MLTLKQILATTQYLQGAKQPWKINSTEKKNLRDINS